MDTAEDCNQDGIYERLLTENLSLHSLHELQQIREKSPQDFSTALKILADGSRCEDRREAYGETGILDWLLELQATSLDVEVRRECIRAIANSCADTGKVFVCFLKASADLHFIR